MQLRFPFLSAAEHPEHTADHADHTDPEHAAGHAEHADQERAAEHAEHAAAEYAEYADTQPVIHFVRMRRARRYVMRVRPDGDLRVTIPRGGSKAEALRFAERHRDWAERQRARVMAGRRPAAVDCELRAKAAAELPPQLLALAAQHGLTVNRVTIRNQRSRWGSCSSRGHITLNFRLMLMPPEVREYILIHELMHMKQANHSIRFWRCVEAACPGFRDAERWLKKHGPSLF